MAASKTATLTLRIEPEIKEALQRAAGLEHRSIANMVEVLIREHCRVKGIATGDTDGFRGTLLRLFRCRWFVRFRRSRHQDGFRVLA